MTQMGSNIACQITVQYEKRYAHQHSHQSYVQIVVLKYLVKAEGRAILETKMSLLGIVFVQYIFRFARFYPLTSNLKKTAGVFTESSWLGAAYYLLWYMLCSHVSTFHLVSISATPSILQPNPSHEATLLSVWSFICMSPSYGIAKRLNLIVSIQLACHFP